MSRRTVRLYQAPVLAVDFSLANIRHDLLGTGIFQPADVGLQRVIKHHLKQDSLDFLVREHAKMVKQGIQPADIKFAHGLPALRDASVQGIVDVWDFLKDEARHGPDIVRKVCFHDLCLFLMSLTSGWVLGMGQMHREGQEPLSRHAHRHKDESKPARIPHHALRPPQRD